MARWMQANLGIGDAGHALPAGAWQRSQRPIAQSKLADGEIDCNGYSLGWYTCSYRGQTALMHPGAYDGAVSVTVLVPSARAGLSLAANSDSAMEGLQLAMIKVSSASTGQPGETGRLRKALAGYPANVRAKAAKRRAANEQDRADPQWAAGAGERMRPACAPARGATPTRCTARCGWCRTTSAWSPTSVPWRDGLEPAQPGLFGASTSALEPPETASCDRGRIGWRGQAFVRQ